MGTLVIVLILSERHIDIMPIHPIVKSQWSAIHGNQVSIFEIYQNVDMIQNPLPVECLESAWVV